MDEITCNATIDIEDTNIVISGLTTTDIIINFSGDIDFTDLVSTLTEKIDECKKIIFKIDENTDEKLKLIIETLNSIFDSYNESISSTDEELIENDEEIQF
jgi:hypothetical protein